jgi:hypothetical protein
VSIYLAGRTATGGCGGSGHFYVVDPIVEAVAGRYANLGMSLFDRELHLVAPTQFHEAALEDEEQAVF